MRIIVLIDFSLYTGSLIKIATNWAELLSAELILVHEVPRLVPAMVDDDTRYTIIDYEKEEALSKLEELAESSISNRIPVDYEVTERPLPNFLPELLTENQNSMIMMGLKGTGLLKKVFIGTVATQIINELNEITVGVPLRIGQATPEHLIIPANPDYAINEEKLDLLLSLLYRSLKKIDFISIEQSGDEKKQQITYLKELSAKFNGDIETSFKIFKNKKNKKVFEEFKSYTEQKENCFLVLQKGGNSLKDMLYKRFFINRIVHDGSIPLIVLPE